MKAEKSDTVTGTSVVNVTVTRRGIGSIQMQNTTLYSLSIVVFQVTQNTSPNKCHVKKRSNI